MALESRKGRAGGGMRPLSQATAAVKAHNMQGATQWPTPSSRGRRGRLSGSWDLSSRDARTAADSHQARVKEGL